MLEADGRQVRDQMEQLLAMMVDRTLWVSGRLPTAAVTGGIPEAALQYHGARAGPARGPRG